MISYSLKQLLSKAAGAIYAAAAAPTEALRRVADFQLAWNQYQTDMASEASNDAMTSSTILSVDGVWGRNTADTVAFVLGTFSPIPSDPEGLAGWLAGEGTAAIDRGFSSRAAQRSIPPLSLTRFGAAPVRTPSTTTNGGSVLLTSKRKGSSFPWLLLGGAALTAAAVAGIYVANK